MYTVSKAKTFQAAHHIEGHTNPFSGEPGICSSNHGHEYKIGIICSAESLHPETGFVIDYSVLGYILNHFHGRYDHSDLNDHSEFQYPYKSTAERIAQFIYEQTIDLIGSLVTREGCPVQLGGGFKLEYVEVSETSGTFARYSR